ncbi:hypothetical protein SETIT_2G005600v2 [Setaria italica]|uniref:BUD13 homolog n=1 Tax=Setaria italica TaxID=4555 RepID=A0A368PTP6_SETIT|nr:hypothetical protein SETIT_2G005600v2 [Setaria italica]
MGEQGRRKKREKEERTGLDKMDLELPRRRARHDSEDPLDLSLPWRRRHDSEEPQDMPPPRRRMRHDSEEPKGTSPPRRPTRHDSEVPKDLSPPRRRKHQDSTKVDDPSPPRRRNLGRSPDDGDMSPPRKDRKFASDDLSPPRRVKRKEPKQTRKAGLMTAEEVKEDIRKIKEDEMLKFAAQDPSLVGKGAKAGMYSEIRKEMHIEWGKGLVQKREAEARIKELEAEKSKPFARTRDDPELDSMLKNRIRWGDPMAHLVKRKDPEFLIEDLGDDEKMKESGFIVPQNIPSHSWLKRVEWILLQTVMA